MGLDNNTRKTGELLNSTKLENAKFCQNDDIISRIFEFGAVQKSANHVEFVKSFQRSVHLQKSASIQPRTGLLKFANNEPTVRTRVRVNIGLRSQPRATSCERCPQPGEKEEASFFHHPPRLAEQA